MKKIIFTTLTVIFTLGICFSQDVITKKSGEDIQAKISEVTSSEIKYKRFDNLNGPTYSILKAEVLMIRYENGTKDIFNDAKVIHDGSSLNSYEKDSLKNTLTNVDSDTTKMINIIYVENKTAIPNKEVFLAYYNETLLKKIVISVKTNQNGVASFIIPASKNSGSSVFYFAFNNMDFSKNKYALRIAPINIYSKAGEKSITLKTNKDYYIVFIDAGVQLIKFPQDGNKVSSGGDILMKGSTLYLQ